MTKQALLDEVVRRVVEAADPERIILFGSAARGELLPDSDLDLLVVKSGVTHRWRLTTRIYDSFSGLGVPVDVVVVTPDDIAKYRDKVGTIIRPALEEGIEIYQAQGPRAPSRPEAVEEAMPLELRDPTDPKEWLRRARSNLTRARADRELADVAYEDLCFDAQQAAEKAIKAILVARQYPFPKTHKIDDLLALAERSGIPVPETVREAHVLNPYAALTRYVTLAGGVTEEDYERALELAERVFRWAESVLA